MESDLFHTFLAFDWPGILVPAISVAEKAFRTVVVYGPPDDQAARPKQAGVC